MMRPPLNQYCTEPLFFQLGVFCFWDYSLDLEVGGFHLLKIQIGQNNTECWSTCKERDSSGVDDGRKRSLVSSVFGSVLRVWR